MTIAPLPQNFTSQLANCSFLPDHVKVAEEWWVNPAAFNIKNREGVSMCAIRKRLWDRTWATLGTHIYNLVDPKEKMLATGSSIGNAMFHIKLKDGEGNLIGSIERIVELFRTHYFWFGTSYKILNAENKKIAIAEMNCLRYRVLILDPKNRENVYATMTKYSPAFSTKYWDIEIKNPKFFRKHSFASELLLMLPAIEIDMANIERTSSD